MLILNDVHLGVNRSGGTTPSSREALRTYLFTSFEGALHDTQEQHVCILGDLFDQFEVAPRDWLQCYMVLQAFCSRGGNLTLVAGNHDTSPKALRVSSFEMLCNVLVEQFGTDCVQIAGINVMRKVEPGIWALAHCENQDTFNRILEQMLSDVVAGDRVLLHANFDNNFAAQSDHSLNVTREQAKAFATKGATLYFAHEHQAREALGGSVVVFGNQWPSSVSDCLNNDKKFAHVMAGGVTRVETWARDMGEMHEGAIGFYGYGEIDWHDLGGWHESGQDPDFIKVTGTATANEAGDCINAISKFRSKSTAFVITNGVHIEGVAANEDLPENFEAAKAFDVMEFIYSNLDEAQTVAVKKLMEAQT